MKFQCDQKILHETEVLNHENHNLVFFSSYAILTFTVMVLVYLKLKNLSKSIPKEQNFVGDIFGRYCKNAQFPTKNYTEIESIP